MRTGKVIVPLMLALLLTGSSPAATVKTDEGNFNVDFTCGLFLQKEKDIKRDGIDMSIDTFSLRENVIDEFYQENSMPANFYFGGDFKAFGGDYGNSTFDNAFRVGLKTGYVLNVRKKITDRIVFSLVPHLYYSYETFDSNGTSEKIHQYGIGVMFLKRGEDTSYFKFTFGGGGAHLQVSNATKTSGTGFVRMEVGYKCIFFRAGYTFGGIREARGVDLSVGFRY